MNGSPRTKAPSDQAATDLPVMGARSLPLLLALLVLGARADAVAAQAALLDRIDQAETELLVELGRASGAAISEVELAAHLIRFVGMEGPMDEGAGDPNGGAPPEAELRVLGDRASEVLLRGRAFRREVIEILADSGDADPSVALRAAVERYQRRAESAVPAAPKNMDVLYDHDSALAFRTSYPELSGFLWAGQWMRLATTEPLTDLPKGAERTAGVDTVAARYLAKLTDGDPPQSFPSELPLAPAIAPGLIWASPEAAMIWDNLSLFTEVIADILASAGTPDFPTAEVPAAIEAAVEFFTSPDQGVTEQAAWELMALRHGIFFQGGYPLAVMTRSELNGNSHAMHMRRGGPMVIPGMIGR